MEFNNKKDQEWKMETPSYNNNILVIFWNRKLEPFWRGHMTRLKRILLIVLDVMQGVFTI